MKQAFLLSLAAAGCAFAGSADALLTSKPQPKDWVDAVKQALVVYENKDTFVTKVALTTRQQWQMASVQPNGSNSLHLKKGATPYNDEFRRNWIGANVFMRTGTQFHTYVRMGGLPVRDTYAGGRTRKNYSYTGFYDIWLKQNIDAVKGLTVRAGKFAPSFTSDFRMSNASMPCIERSYVANQFALDTNWGVEVNYTSPDKKNILYLQVQANDRACATCSPSHRDHYGRGEGFEGEFGWEDKCFAILGGTHKFNVSESGYHAISGEYVHDFNNAYHGRRKPGANNYGIDFKDAISLGYEIKHNKLTFTTNAVAAFEQQDGNGTNNIGIQLQPVYAVHPNVDLVFRYNGMTGDGACKLGADRYICTQSTASSWVDSLHAFYFGVNLYASEKAKDAAKLMFGAEYTTARKDGKDCYNGWEYSAAVRCNF